MDVWEMSLDWRRSNQKLILAKLKSEVIARRSGVRKFYCRNLFKYFGYSARSADAAEHLENLLKQSGMKVTPSIRRGRDGYQLETKDWVEISRDRSMSPSSMNLASSGLAFPSGIATAGNGPYGKDAFESFLKGMGYKIQSMGTKGSDVLVIGRRDWDKADLNRHLDLRAGSDLKVYSQEMFLAYLATGMDPFDDQDLLDEFGDGHPALEHLMVWGFDWPTTHILPSNNGKGPNVDDWPDVGLLKHMEYTVGVNGKSLTKRREALLKVFNSHRLDNVQSREYMAEWGEAGSAKRLHKMADTLASFVRNSLRRQRPAYKAIEHWSEDLDWLEETLYRGRFRFQWPSTHVG